MPRDYKVYLDDILESAQKIRDFISEISIDDIEKDPKTLDAVIRNLEVIGEAIKNIPEEIRDKHPDIEWKKIAGLRDILIHGYFRINIKIIRDVIKNKLPVLEERVEKILLED